MLSNYLEDVFSWKKAVGFGGHWVQRKKRWLREGLSTIGTHFSRTRWLSPYCGPSSSCFLRFASSWWAWCSSSRTTPCWNSRFRPSLGSKNCKWKVALVFRSTNPISRFCRKTWSPMCQCTILSRPLLSTLTRVSWSRFSSNSRYEFKELPYLSCFLISSKGVVWVRMLY